MNYSCRAISLLNHKYGEESIIAKIFTEEYGLVSYSVKRGRSKKSKNKISLLQHMSLINISAQKNQEKHIQHTEKLIQKFKAKASKASMAQSLMKKIEKIDRIEVDQDDNSVMKLNFNISINPGKVVAEIENLSKSYDDNNVLSNVNLLIERKSKIAFVGQNGQGKSTLAKIMVGELTPSSGNSKLGHNVQIGYFAQNQAEYLDGSKTVLQTMIDSANETNRSKVRDVLGSFLFKGDDVEKYVRVLSGGERNRLALAKLLLQPFNVLVMDEPTNHLDIKSKSVLKQALVKFDGTLILVSHDRDFLQDLTNKVYEFKSQNIKEYLGDIDFYLNQRKIEDFREIEKKDKVINVKKNKNIDSLIERDLKKRISNVESKISRLENEISIIDKDLEEDYEKTISRDNFFSNYEKKKSDLDSLMNKCEKLSL